MNQLLVLIFTYAYLEAPFYLGAHCSEKVQASLAEGNTYDSSSHQVHIEVEKRGNPYKRLPAWSVYYGKRSGNDQSPVDVQDSLVNNGEQTLELAKRPSFKRLHSWFSTYGKRSLDTESTDLSSMDKDDIEGDSLELDGEFSDEPKLQDMSESLLDDLKESEDFENEDDKRIAGWSATYGKRMPGWSATYGKRMPGWSATYGKRMPGWSATYGKRIPGWSATYGKRIAGWSATYGKRMPGWAATYGKRSPQWAATYGKRMPGWAATYGKRMPGWAATYGKRMPGWSATYGKRSPQWAATYGKRMAGWSAIYGKRAENEFTDNLDTLREQLNSGDSVENDQQKRGSQAWSAFYGR